MLKKSEAVVESIEGFDFTDEQKWRMLKVREHFQYLNQLIDDIDSKLDVLTTPFKPHIDLLCTIPGIKHDSAVTILSEIGVDMSQFFAAGLGLLLQTINLPERRSQLKSQELVSTSNLVLFKSLMLLLSLLRNLITKTSMSESASVGAKNER